MKLAAAVVISFLSASGAFSQSLSNGSLNGKYFFRHLLIEATGSGAIAGMRTAYGAITFDGSGAYTCAGSQIVGTAAPVAFSVSGAYAVKATGYVSLSNPQRAGVDLNAGLGQGALVGASTETTGVYDLFIAVQAPSGAQSNLSFAGSYDVSALEFPGATATQVRNATFRLTAAGNGSAGNLTVTGKTSDRNSTSTISNATYSISSDGSGTLTLPGSGLLNGTRALWISSDNSLALFGSTSPGGHDIWIGSKSFNGTANASSFQNLFFRTGLRFDTGRSGIYAGSSNSTGVGKLVSSLRVRQPEGVLDLTAPTTIS